MQPFLPFFAGLCITGVVTLTYLASLEAYRMEIRASCPIALVECPK